MPDYAIIQNVDSGKSGKYKRRNYGNVGAGEENAPKLTLYLWRVLFEEVQYTGDCGITGRLADRLTKPPDEKKLDVISFQEGKIELRLFDPFGEKRRLPCS